MIRIDGEKVGYMHAGDQFPQLIGLFKDVWYSIFAFNNWMPANLKICSIMIWTGRNLFNAMALGIYAYK